MGPRGGAIVRLLGVTAALLTVAAAAACGGSAGGSAATPAPTPGGTYTVALGMDPVAIVPLNAVESAGQQVVHQVFQGLARYERHEDGTVRAEPDIAQSWSANGDASVWTFRLKRGVTFQPPVRREVTARDFMRAWSYVADPANGSGLAYMLAPIRGTGEGGYAANGLTGVEALDRYTLRVRLKYPYADFPALLGMPVVAVWPVEHLRKVGAQVFENRPVGTGPYMVARWVHNEYIDLVRSPDYWDQERAGYVDAVHLPIVSQPPTDDIGEGQWRLFQKGELDMAAVTPERFAALRGNEKVESGEWVVKAWPNLTLQYVGVNMTSPRVGGDENLPLRQALSYAVDQRAVVDPVMRGTWVLPTGILPAGIPGAGQAGLAYPYDPEKARELVAGMGTTPSVDLWCISGHGYEQMARALKAAWERVGIRVELKQEQYRSFYLGLAEGKADLFITGWFADYPAAETVLSALFHSRTSGSYSYTFYNDPETDRLLDLARGTMDDVRRAQLYSEAEATILEDAPLVPLYFGAEPRVTDTRVQGQAVTPMMWTDMWKVWVKAAE